MSIYNTTAHDAHMARQSEASEQYQNAQAVAAADGWGHTLLPNNQHYAEGNKRALEAMRALNDCQSKPQFARPQDEMRADDKQVSGSHYKDMPIQPWAVMESVLTQSEFIGYLKGNIIKYSLRAGRKEGSDDAGKAQHYMEKLNEMQGSY